MPDLPDGWNQYTTYDSRWFSTRFTVVALLDYDAFTQDDDSRKQVDEQQDQWDLRTFRLMFRGPARHPNDCVRISKRLSNSHSLK